MLRTMPHNCVPLHGTYVDKFSPKGGLAPRTTPMPQQILLVEDEQEIADLLSLHLAGNEHEITHESCGERGMALALSRQWDLAILDRGLPKLDGVDICRALRQQSPDTGVILLTARDSEIDRVLGLELGADDYITKPFSIMELLARIRSVMRRAKNSVPSDTPPTSISIGELTLDASSHEVSIGRNSIDLTAREFSLLWQFASTPGRIFSRAELLDRVWGSSFEGYEHTVNSHINRLRQKIERDPSQPDYIKTVRGVGYKLNAS